MNENQIQLTLGSLFDGIAGFPLAAAGLGIKTIWTSEIEPNCVEIAARHFPEAKQLGDITKLNGADIDPVDIISFGSPCQNLSTAGNQKGLDGEKSQLFFEAVRIVTLSGRMWQGLFQAIKGRISAECLKKSQKPTFQCLIVEDGQQPEWLEAGGAVQLGEKWTLNIGEYPSEERECTLFTVLEMTVPDKYYLSAKACCGILRRAKQRGRTLPGPLEEALKQQIQRQQSSPLQEMQ